MWAAGYRNAVQMVNELAEELPQAPSERTVRGIIRPWREAEAAAFSAEAWDFMDPGMSPEDARIVVDFYATSDPAYPRLRPRLTPEDARRFVRLRRAFPELSLESAWLAAVLWEVSEREEREERLIEGARAAASDTSSATHRGPVLKPGRATGKERR